MGIETRSTLRGWFKGRSLSEMLGYAVVFLLVLLILAALVSIVAMFVGVPALVGGYMIYGGHVGSAMGFASLTSLIGLAVLCVSFVSAKRFEWWGPFIGTGYFTGFVVGLIVAFGADYIWANNLIDRIPQEVFASGFMPFAIGAIATVVALIVANLAAKAAK